MSKDKEADKEQNEVHSVSVGGSGTIQLIEVTGNSEAELYPRLVILGLDDERRDLVFQLFMNGLTLMAGSGGYRYEIKGAENGQKYLQFEHINRDDVEGFYAHAAGVMNNLSSRLGSKKILDERLLEHRAQLQEASVHAGHEMALTRKANWLAGELIKYLEGKGCVISADAEKGLPAEVKELLSKVKHR